MPSEIALLYPQASTDQSTIDTDIPYRLGGLSFAVIQLLGIVAIMYQMVWRVFVVFISVTAICLWYQVSNFAP